ncbi:hypothetical protein CR513_12967, partial [Mucuna pruriens]
MAKVMTFVKPHHGPLGMTKRLDENRCLGESLVGPRARPERSTYALLTTSLLPLIEPLNNYCPSPSPTKTSLRNARTTNNWWASQESTWTCINTSTFSDPSALYTISVRYLIVEADTSYKVLIN